MTRRRLLALCCGALAGWAGPAWAGHPSIRTVVTITPESLKKIVDSQRAPVFLFDLRPAQEYRRGRLPGAVSRSVVELEQRITEIPFRDIVVLYCACSVDDITPLYERLWNRGYRNLLLLQDGYRGWEARGYPVER